MLRTKRQLQRKTADDEASTSVQHAFHITRCPRTAIVFTVKSAKALAEEGPQTTQAGGHNFSSGTAKYSFVFHPGAWPDKVKIFAHTTKFSEGSAD